MIKPFQSTKKVILFYALFILILPVACDADPSFRMHRDMMDDESYGRMMEDRNYGPRGNYDGRARGHMMGRDMMGTGMMGSGMLGNISSLNLTDEQRKKVRNIQRSTRQAHFELMKNMMDTSDKLVDLYDADRPDPKKIGEVYDEVYKIKRQMIQQHIVVRNKIYDILDEEQRKQYKEREPFAHRFGMNF